MVYEPRIPIADSYAAAMGRAGYNFAYLEWGIVWLCETLDRGFINTVDDLTAGQIARHFDEVVKGLPAGASDKERLETLSGSFIDLVKERNGLMHGRPFTGEGGEQRLLYRGKGQYKDWTVDCIIDAARAYEVTAIEVGYLLDGGRLKAYQTATGIDLTAD